MASTRGYTDFQPSTEWTEDPKHHVLNINLPGFRKDEFRVQVDSSGKLTVRGGKTLGDGKYWRLEQVFDIPKDSYIDKISGKFEQGRLSLFMPKKVAETEKLVAEDKKEEAPIQKDRPKTTERKEGESIQKEKPKGGEETEEAPSVDKKKPVAEEEPIEKKRPKGEEEMKEPSTVYKEKPPTKEAPIQKEMPKGEKETKAAAPVYEEKPLTGGKEEVEEEQPIEDEPISKQKPKREEHPVQVEPIQKRKPRSGTVSDDGFEKYKKKGMAWKESIEEKVEGWLDNGLMDGLMETISKNKKVIALAVAAFTAGFYASQKLRLSRR